MAPHGTIEEPRMRIIRDKNEIKKVYVSMVNEAISEILLLMPTTNAYIREVEIGVIAALQSAADRNVVVRMLTPDPSEREEIRKFNSLQEAILSSKLIAIKRIREAKVQNTVTILVVDKTSSLIIEQQDDKELDFSKAIGIATYSARGSTVKANIRFFERMWEEVEDREDEQILLEKERRSRREAELLQDILAHDLRNFNQIILTNAELLKDVAADYPSREAVFAASEIIDAVYRSSQLIDRAKKLGKIISQEFHPSTVSLKDSIKRSVDVVTKSHGLGFINPHFAIDEDAYVLADDLLDEVFVNVLANAVKYASDRVFPVEIKVEDSINEHNKESNRFRQFGGIEKFWKLSIIDHGPGIPDSIKKRLFTRYLDTASGSGLGLSIVHALVVDRYGGIVKIRDRIEGNHGNGTVVEISLQQSKRA